MSKLRTEYTDIKDVKHHVEHLNVNENDSNREQILEELFIALTRKGKRTSA